MSEKEVASLKNDPNGDRLLKDFDLVHIYWSSLAEHAKSGPQSKTCGFVPWAKSFNGVFDESGQCSDSLVPNNSSLDPNLADGSIESRPMDPNLTDGSEEAMDQEVTTELEEEPRPELDTAKDDEEWEDIVKTNDNEGVKKKSFQRPPNFKLSFVRLLQHFYVMGNISLFAMTCFLKLLHLFTPYIDYNTLPRTARTLVKIRRTDKMKVSKRQVKNKLNEKIGTYVHFGLKDGIMGTSAGK